jgi:opacity protein-like surface antigen
MRTFAKLLAVVVALSMAGSSLGAQAPVTKPPEQVMKVEVVLSRYQGDKRTSNMPFTLWLSAPANGGGGGASLRVGVDVPIGSTAATTTESRMNPAGRGQNTTGTTEATTRPEYRNVGTSVDANAWLESADGQYRVRVSLTDTSVFEPDSLRTADAAARAVQGVAVTTASNASAFRTFSLSNTLPMRDGQTIEFASATDKITGETVKLTVTINVAK